MCAENDKKKSATQLNDFNIYVITSSKVGLHQGSNVGKNITISKTASIFNLSINLRLILPYLLWDNACKDKE